MDIIAVDEVGTGSWAGPAVVCAVKAHKDWTLPGLNDSKKLSRKIRSELSAQLFELINAKIISYNLEIFNNDEIDRLGLLTFYHIHII